MEFRWNKWNEEHIANHGVVPGEAEAVVRSGLPRYRGDGKYLTIGRGQGGLVGCRSCTFSTMTERST
jgi:hypothetical protein